MEHKLKLLGLDIFGWGGRPHGGVWAKKLCICLETQAKLFAKTKLLAGHPKIFSGISRKRLKSSRFVGVSRGNTIRGNRTERF